jgi:hypothetical protein
MRTQASLRILSRPMTIGETSWFGPAANCYMLTISPSSLRTATVIASVLGRAGERGQKRRLKDAKLGEVTWHNPTEIQKFLEIQAAIKLADDEAARKAADLERKSSGDIPGMMNQAQLEAFQLLQEVGEETVMQMMRFEDL